MSAILCTTALNTEAIAAERIAPPAAVIMTQINTAKLNILGHLTGEKNTKPIIINGARIKDPKYAEATDRNTKIWFTTEEGQHHKWPFIDLYDGVSSIEPAAGKAKISKPQRLYNHYSGPNHRDFVSALPSAFNQNNTEPFYAALNLPPTRRPEPRPLSFVK